ncbi:MAG: flotillin family protein, partial [Oscillospiraceae bacterium]|nr:flotillin family protein [Oscillospiraceae bacterium]
ALPEVVKNAAAPLAQTDRIVMYGDGNSTKLVKDVMSSASQVMDGVKESTGLDITALLAGAMGGRLAAASQPVTLEVKTGGASEAKAASKPEEAPESEV